jgi:transketolase
VAAGAYVLADAPAPRLVLIATGSEVSLALAAHAELARAGIPARVVSMPSFELFAAQPAAYREQVLPARLRARLAIEAGSTLGWERWVGSEGRVLGIDRYGASAPAATLLEQLGFTLERVVALARELAGG